MLRVILYLHFMRRTLDMNGIYYAQLNESNLTSLGCLIGRKSHQSCRYYLHNSSIHHINVPTYGHVRTHTSCIRTQRLCVQPASAGTTVRPTEIPDVVIIYFIVYPSVKPGPILATRRRRGHSCPCSIFHLMLGY